MAWKLRSTIGALSLWPILVGAANSSSVAQDGTLTSGWVNDHASRVRLTAGAAPVGAVISGLVAGIEFKLEDGWKTYWRHPGTSGVPPRFDWSGSDNLTVAAVSFPAPQRFADSDGETIGYKSAVVLPVVLSAKDPSRAITLKLDMEYGVCKDVCIPVQAVLQLTVPPGAAGTPVGLALAEAIDRVPLPPERAGQLAPKVQAIDVDLAASKPQITIDAVFAKGAKGTDAFLEAPQGAWLPMTRAVEGAPQGTARFIVDLTDGADLADLKGRTIRLTLVSDSGQLETSFVLE